MQIFLKNMLPSMQALPQLPSGQNRHLLEQYAAPAPAPDAMSPVRPETVNDDLVHKCRQM